MENDLTKYRLSRDQMQTGDCLLYSGRSLIGKLIEFFTRSKFNHARLVLRIDQNAGLDHQVWTLEALADGITLGLLSRVLETYSGHAWWYPLKDEYDSLRNRMGEWALSKVGTPYNYEALISNALTHVAYNPDYLRRSEFNQGAWEEVGIVKSAKTLRPNEIPKLRIFKEPYKSQNCNGVQQNLWDMIRAGPGRGLVTWSLKIRSTICLVPLQAILSVQI
jgi:hypothetical protein